MLKKILSAKDFGSGRNIRDGPRETTTILNEKSSYESGTVTKNTEEKNTESSSKRAFREKLDSTLGRPEHKDGYLKRANFSASKNHPQMSGNWGQQNETNVLIIVNLVILIIFGIIFSVFLSSAKSEIKSLNTKLEDTLQDISEVQSLNKALNSTLQAVKNQADTHHNSVIEKMDRHKEDQNYEIQSLKNQFSQNFLNIETELVQGGSE